MPRLKLYRPRPWDRDGLACGLFPMSGAGQGARLTPRRPVFSLAWLLGLRPRRRLGRRLLGAPRPKS